MVFLFLIIWQTFMQVFHSSCTFTHSHQQWTRIPIPPHPCQTCYCLFLDYSCPNRCEVIVYHGFNLHFLDKDKVVYTYNRLLFRFQDQGNPVLYDNIYTPGKHDAKWNEPIIEGQYCMIALALISNSQTHRNWEWNGGCRGCGWGQWEVTLQRLQKLQLCFVWSSRDLLYNTIILHCTIKKCTI